MSAEHAADAAAGGARVVGDVWRPMDAWVPLGSSLRTAYAKLLQVDAGWVGVMDGEKLVGVLTPASVHAALRRSVAGASPRPPASPDLVVGGAAGALEHEGGPDQGQRARHPEAGGERVAGGHGQPTQLPAGVDQGAGPQPGEPAPAHAEACASTANRATSIGSTGWSTR